MSRIVALDVGDATVGIAATDELNIIVSPIKTIRRTKSIKVDLRLVEEVLGELNASKVIMGNPLDADGNEGPQAIKVKDFYDRLARRLNIPVLLWDERYSTSEAHERLINMDVSRAKRREIIDQVAAAIILESYLQENK